MDINFGSTLCVRVPALTMNDADADDAPFCCLMCGGTHRKHGGDDTHKSSSDSRAFYAKFVWGVVSLEQEHDQNNGPATVILTTTTTTTTPTGAEEAKSFVCLWLAPNHTATTDGQNKSTQVLWPRCKKCISALHCTFLCFEIVDASKWHGECVLAACTTMPTTWQHFQSSQLKSSLLGVEINREVGCETINSWMN